MASPNRVACLLLHGFGGTPFEMEPLAAPLKALGCTVDLPTLPGHDGDIGHFHKTFYPDWLAHAEERFLSLGASHDSVFLVGFSMGGSIALTLAARYARHPALKGVAALAPAWRIYRLSAIRPKTAWLLLAPLLRHCKKTIALPPPHPESRAIAPFAGYDKTLYLPHVHSLAQGVAGMRRLLHELVCPLLLLCDARDSVCPPDGALRIARASSSVDMLFRLYRMRETVTSHHMLTTHRETGAAVANEVTAFIAARM